MSKIQHPIRFSPEGEWQEELRELESRRNQALAMGGAQALAKLHSAGRMDVSREYKAYWMRIRFKKWDVLRVRVIKTKTASLFN